MDSTTLLNMFEKPNHRSKLSSASTNHSEKISLNDIERLKNQLNSLTSRESQQLSAEYIEILMKTHKLFERIVENSW